MELREELEQAVAVDDVARNRCCVQVTNELPEAWKIRIVGVGTTFFFQTNGSLNGQKEVVSRNTSLGYKGSTTYCTTQADKCVRRTYTVVVVQDDETGKQQQYAAREDTGNNECFTFIPYTMAPTSGNREAAFHPDGLVLRRRG